jgi:hypothetical protein
MAANPVVVTTDCSMTWDGVKTRLNRGQVIDMATAQGTATTNVPPGTASNPANLSTRVVALSAQQQVPGSSDSLGQFGTLSSATAGGGTDPYNAGQAG